MVSLGVRQHRLRELTAAFGELTPQSQTVESLLADVAETLGVEIVAFFNIARVDGLLRMVRGGAVGFDFGAHARAFDEVSQSGLRPVMYDPYAVRSHERNRVTLRTPAEVSAFFRDRPAYGVWSKARGVHQLGAVIADGPQMLGWFGAVQRERPSAEQQTLLQHLVPALRRRLSRERLLGAGWAFQAIEHLLEAIPTPAALANAHGALSYANASMRAEVGRDKHATLEEVKLSLRNASSRFRHVPVRSPGHPPLFLVLGDPHDPRARSAMAAAEQHLSIRQREVFDALLRGRANKEIAVELGISVPTVETHVAAIFRRFDVSSRTELAARVLGH